MNDFGPILNYQLGANTVREIVYAIGIFIGLLIVFKISEVVLLANFKKLAKKTKTKIDDMLVESIEKVPTLFYLALALYIPLRYLNLPVLADKIINPVFLIIVTYQVIQSVEVIIEFAIRKFTKRATHEEDAETLFVSLRIITKVILWAIGLILILSNVGVNVTSLVASLGIGGIAIALAVQNILGDLISSFSIYFDRPFAIGDHITVGADQGTVKKIGMKTTRIETLQGEELVIPNAELTSTRVQNFRKMKKRRILFNIGVTYSTSVEKLEKAKEIIKEAIESAKLAEVSRIHFREFGDSSLNIEVAYFVNSREYEEAMDTREEINFAIKEGLEEAGVEMAFPTQTVQLQK